MAQKRIRRTVKTEDISCSGPIRHEQLTPEQEARRETLSSVLHVSCLISRLNATSTVFGVTCTLIVSCPSGRHVQRRSSNTCGRRAYRTRNWPQPSSNYPLVIRMVRITSWYGSSRNGYSTISPAIQARSWPCSCDPTKAD